VTFFTIASVFVKNFLEIVSYF